VDTGAAVAYNYLPAMSTYLQSLVNGFAGIRLRDNRLDVNPTLPVGVSLLNLVGLDYLGVQLNVLVRDSEVVVVQKSPYSGTQLSVRVFDPEEIYMLEPGREVRYQRRKASIISVSEPLPT